MVSLRDVGAIDDESTQRLIDFGVTNSERLLLVAAHKQGREDLAQETGVSEDSLLRLVRFSEMVRIKGIGGEYAALLQSAGVEDVRELSKRNPDQLHRRLSDLNAENRVVRRLPSPQDIAHWIAHAASLKSIVRS